MYILARDTVQYLPTNIALMWLFVGILLSWLLPFARQIIGSLIGLQEPSGSLAQGEHGDTTGSNNPRLAVEFREALKLSFRVRRVILVLVAAFLAAAIVEFFYMRFVAEIHTLLVGFGWNSLFEKIIGDE